MDNVKKSYYPFLIPSIADILFLSIFLYLSFSVGNRLLSDCDTGYHIRAGEVIIDTLSVPRQDMFSFISPPLPWTAHEWLSEVIMALVHMRFGLTGVVIFFIFLLALIYYLFFKILKTYRGNILAACLIILFSIASSQIHWLARPHIFSLFFMVLWYYILDLYQYNNKNYLYVLPLTMLPWVNLHGGFMGGFILIGLYFFGNLLRFLFSGRADEESRMKSRALGLTVSASLLASLVNPYGFHILLFPFTLTSNKFIMDNVHEFLSPNFHATMPFEYMVFFLIIIFAISSKAPNIIELLLVLLFTHMALYSARYIPLFAIVVSPVLLRQTAAILDKKESRFIGFIRNRGDGIARTDASARGYLWPVAGVMLVIILAAGGEIEFKFDRKTKPVDAVEFMKREGIRGNMFNNDEFGDYIIYDAWPGYKVFADGRADMYGAEKMKEYFKVTKLQPGWDEVLKKYGVNWIIYNANSPLSLFLMERKDWKLIYADKVANIFVRNTPENSYLISKYPDVKLIIEKDKKNPDK